MHVKVEDYLIKQLTIVACVTLGFIMSGYSGGWGSPVLDKLLDEEQSPFPEVITTSQASWVASAYMVGTLIGPLIIGFLANVIGRKLCIILASSTILSGYVLAAVALDIIWIYCGRFIKGIGVSGIVTVNIMYIGEVASPNIRGTIMAATSVFHTIGVMLVFSIGPFVGYRVVSYIIIGIAVVHILSCTFVIPESPVYEVLKDKEKGAIETLKRLGRSKDIDTELAAMVEVNKQNQAGANISQLFTIKSNRMALLINVVLMCLNFGGGIMVVLNYAIIIFRDAASSVEPEIASIITGATQFVGAIVTPFFIDKYGRKTLLLLSTALCSISLTILGVYFYLESINYSAIESIRWLPLFALTAFLFCFSFGVNVIPNTLLGETFRPNMRSAGSATVITIAGLAALASTFSFSFLVDAAGNHTVFWMYAAINLTGFFFTLFVVPETKGKSLMEIEALLGGSVISSSRKPSATA